MTRKRQCISVVRNALFALTTAAAAAFALLAREAPAFAQARFGDKGQLAITGENLFSLQTERFAESPPPLGLEFAVTQNRFGFLYSQGTPSPHGPQAGIHFFVIPSLSIGGTIGYEARGGSHTERRGPGESVVVTLDDADSSTFNLQFKIGYALMFSDVVGLWFRGGPGYFRVGTQQPANGDKDTWSYWLLSLDALLVVSPFRNFAFYAGPQGDISFAGSRSHTEDGVTASWGGTYRDIGIGLGLIGYVNL
ncbi:MAG TPA: hypothetical protein VF881_13850 [Polyangiaceae bacterium]